MIKLIREKVANDDSLKGNTVSTKIQLAIGATIELEEKNNFYKSDHKKQLENRIKRLQDKSKRYH